MCWACVLFNNYLLNICDEQWKFWTYISRLVSCPCQFECEKKSWKKLTGIVAESLRKYYENIWFLNFIEELEVELEKEMVEIYEDTKVSNKKSIDILLSKLQL